MNINQVESLNNINDELLIEIEALKDKVWRRLFVLYINFSLSPLWKIGNNKWIFILSI